MLIEAGAFIVFAEVGNRLLRFGARVVAAAVVFRAGVDFKVGFVTDRGISIPAADDESSEAQADLAKRINTQSTCIHSFGKFFKFMGYYHTS